MIQVSLAKLVNKDNKLRTATLLTCIGPKALETFDGLDFNNDTDRMDIELVLQKLEAFCIDDSKPTYEHYKVNKHD